MDFECFADKIFTNFLTTGILSIIFIFLCFFLFFIGNNSYFGENLFILLVKFVLLLEKKVFELILFESKFVLKLFISLKSFFKIFVFLVKL